MIQNEQKTIKKAASGDRLAFRALVQEHSHAMFRLAWRLTCDESAADDIVQEVFIKAWKKLGDFRMQSSLRSWLHRITVNTSMDYLRKQTRIRNHETGHSEWDRIPQAAATPKHDVQIDIQAQTRAAMMTLSEKERTALMLRHYEGYSIREIAQIMNLNTTACKQAIFRAVKKMRVELMPLVTT